MSRVLFLLLSAGSLVLAGLSPAYAAQAGAPAPQVQRVTGAQGPAPLLSARTSTTETRKVQHITVSWKGTHRSRDYSESAVIPGIGMATLVCRPDTTMIRLFAQDRTAETQMWMSKYETKNDRSVVAVKTARIYRYANADDDGTGGTGRYTHEGFNQSSPIEDHSSGYINGVISQRPGRNESVSEAALKPVTSFRLNWWWTGFRHDMDWRSCKVDAVFRTHFEPRLGLNWHGDEDAEGHVLQTTTLPGLGDLLIRCETTRDGIQSIGLVPTSEDSRVWVEYVTGEGLVEDHVDSFGNDYDPESGKLGPFLLPRNGMMRLYFDVGDKSRAIIVSSYALTNNRLNPQLNLCEVAAAVF